MSAASPAVLLSSTFYDLAQLRSDLSQFLTDQMGYRILAFEDSSFPVDPSVNTIENCRQRVEREADILVLVIGSRYGHVDEPTKKSVTNLEYLAARAKGIPIYAFIDKQTLTHYENWKRHPENKFDGIVDSVALFEFIELIRSKHNLWTHPFERAQEIVHRLRIQFAFLMHEALLQRSLLNVSKDEALLRSLRGVAYRIALERPRIWEHRLFNQVLLDELEACRDLKMAYDMGFVTGPGPQVNASNFEWPITRLGELKRLAESFDTLVNKEIQIAMGPPGVHGDARRIVFIARAFAEIYRAAIEWTQSVRRAVFHEFMQEMQTAMCMFSGDVIKKIQFMSDEMNRSLLNADETLAAGNTVTFTIHMKLVFEGLEEFGEATSLAAERFKANVGG